jgi:hypothetical protein
MRDVILSEAKNLPYEGQMFRLRLNMTIHQNTCDEPIGIDFKIGVAK